MGASQHKVCQDLGNDILPIGVMEVDTFFANSKNYIQLIGNLRNTLDKRLKKFDQFITQHLPDDCYKSFKESLIYFLDHLPVNEVKIEEYGEHGVLRLIVDNKRLFGNMVDIHQALQQLLEIAYNIMEHTPELIDHLKQTIEESEEFVANARSLADQAGLKDEEIDRGSDRFVNNIKIINQSLAYCYNMSDCAKQIHRDVRLQIGSI